MTLTAFQRLLKDPFEAKSYLVTVRPIARVVGQISAVAATNRLVGPAETFSGLRYGDRLQTQGFGESGNQGWLTVLRVQPPDVDDPTGTPGGAWVSVLGLTLEDEAAGSRKLIGEVVRTYSTHGLVTGPAESPANTIYDPRIENALRYKRSLINGTAIGGRSIPGFGDVQLHNRDGDLDHMRGWGWAGRPITVELGGPLFARADYGVIFKGLTAAVKLSSEFLTIAVADLLKLLDRPLWSPAYQGTGGLEGNVDALGTLKPLRFAYQPHVELALIGIVNGRFNYQIHDGRVPAWHATDNPAIVRDGGVQLEYVASNPGPKQWTLDATAGLVILGGSPAGIVTFTGKGAAEAAQAGTLQAGGTVTIRLAASAIAVDGHYVGLPVTFTGGTGSGQASRITAYVGSTREATLSPALGVATNGTSTYEVGGYVDAAPDLARLIATTRLLLESEPSTTSLAVGTGPKTLDVPTTLPIGVGGNVLIAKRDEPEVWMAGQVTAWAGGSATVAVARSAGLGTFDDWTVTKLGLLLAELDLDSFAALYDKNPARTALAVEPEETALDVLDMALDSIGGFYGFTRAGIFEVGRFEAAEGEPEIAVDGNDTLDIQLLESRPPTWWLALGYLPNDRVLEGGDLADSIRENVVTNGTFDSATGWTAGTGWAIGSSKATATAGTGSDLSRTIELILGETYVLEAGITATAGTVQPKIGAASIGAAVSATAAISREFVAAAASTTIVFSKDAAFAGEIDAVSITVKLKSFLEKPSRFTLPKVDGSIRQVFGLDAVAEKRPTRLVDLAAAEAERDRQFALHSEPRQVFLAPMKTQPFQLDVARALSLSDRRFGLNDSLGRTLSIDEDAGNDRATAAVWI